jgi:hypothetical protein
MLLPEQPVQWLVAQNQRFCSSFDFIHALLVTCLVFALGEPTAFVGHGATASQDLDTA